MVAVRAWASALPLLLALAVRPAQAAPQPQDDAVRLGLALVQVDPEQGPVGSEQRDSLARAGYGLLADPAELRWEDIASWRDVPPAAVWCGYQYINDDLARRERAYVARVYRGGGLVPGKATYYGASAAHANSTFSSIPNFEVAIGGAGRVRWTPASNGNVPPGAPVAGLTKDGQPLYACRFHSERRLSMACGAVQRFSERCTAEMDGNLLSSAVYEVLVLATPTSPATAASSRPLPMAPGLPALPGPLFQLLSPAGVGVSYRSMQEDSPRAPSPPAKDSTVMEVAKEAPKETVKEIAKDVTKEPPKDVTKDVAKEPPKDVTKDVAKEVARETVKEVAKEVAKEAPKEPVVRDAGPSKEAPAKEGPAGPAREPSRSRDVLTSTSAPVAAAKEDMPTRASSAVPPMTAPSVAFKDQATADAPGVSLQDAVGSTAAPLKDVATATGSATGAPSKDAPVASAAPTSAAKAVAMSSPSPSAIPKEVSATPGLSAAASTSASNSTL